MKFSCKVLNLIFCGLAFSCAQTKTSESVFPSSIPTYCQTSTIKNQYLVQWEDGSFTVEYKAPHESEDDFRKNFVEKNLERIKFVDRDIEIKINPRFEKINEALAKRTNKKNTINNQNTNLIHSQNYNHDTFYWAVDRIKGRELWNRGIEGKNILVGVIDGYLDSSHHQLEEQIHYSRQFNNEINDPFLNKHGTHVAGIIAADSKKGLAVGIAPKAKIISGQFMNNRGAGSISNAIIAMSAVADQGAKIINLSWGGAPCVENLKAAIQNMSDRNILVVTSAGNEGMNSDAYPTYPAAFKIFNQINVGSTGLYDLLSPFSNRGYSSVHIAAPGEAIVSTVPNNTVESMDGTSMSAPLLSGAAALLMSAFPNASAQQIKASLLRTVDIPQIPNQTQTGGRLNVEKAYLDLHSQFDN